MKWQVHDYYILILSPPPPFKNPVYGPARDFVCVCVCVQEICQGGIIGVCQSREGEGPATMTGNTDLEAPIQTCSLSRCGSWILGGTAGFWVGQQANRWCSWHNCIIIFTICLVLLKVGGGDFCQGFPFSPPPPYYLLLPPHYIRPRCVCCIFMHVLFRATYFCDYLLSQKLFDG